MRAKCRDLAYPSQEYVRTMGQTVERVILTTVDIWKTTHNPVYMDNRAYLEIAYDEPEGVPYAITYSNRSGS